MHVILIHGQGRTPLSMIWLAHRLRRQKHQVSYFGYLAFAENFETIVWRFIKTIHDKTAGQPYAIIAHSLGGIITRAALPYLEGHLPEHLVMLASPNQPAMMAKKMYKFLPYRWLTGNCGQYLASKTFYSDLPVPEIPTTVIAGTRGWPVPISPFGNRPNDLVLMVEETQLDGAKTFPVPATHPLIMNSKQAARIILKLLAGEIPPGPGYASAVEPLKKSGR